MHGPFDTATEALRFIEVTEHLTRTGPSLFHPPFDTATKALRFIETLWIGESEVTIRDLKTKEKLELDDLKTQATAEQTYRDIA